MPKEQSGSSKENRSHNRGYLCRSTAPRQCPCAELCKCAPCRRRISARRACAGGSALPVQYALCLNHLRRCIGNVPLQQYAYPRDRFGLYAALARCLCLPRSSLRTAAGAVGDCGHYGTCPEPPRRCCIYIEEYTCRDLSAPFFDYPADSRQIRI